MELEQVIEVRTPLRAVRTRLSFVALLAVAASLPVFGMPLPPPADTGILLLAHGGAPSWNALVTDLAARVNKQAPIEVAFGMADRSTMQAAVDRLVQRGVQRIVAVPLFVSSHSSVFESSEYLLGARPKAPADLRLFASMRHDAGGMTMAPAPAAHHSGSTETSDGMRPVTSPVPIRFGHALDHHPAVAAILAARAREMSRTPASEVVVIVAHGPTSDKENQLWVRDMEMVSKEVREAAAFVRVDYLTVRDDAPAAVREQAAQHLRDTVARAASEGHRVLLVPLLLAYGGIEEGVRKRLEGFDYQMATQGLLPDERLVQWVLESARKP